MKKSYFLITAFLTVLTCVSGLHAQQPAQQAQQPPVIVGIVDVLSLFQKHPLLADNIPMVQQEMQKYQLEFAKTNQEAQKKVAELQQQFKVGSEEYKTQIRLVEDEVLKAKRGIQEKTSEIEQNMAKIQYKVYQDVKSAIEYVAHQKGAVAVFVKISFTQKNVPEEVRAIKELDQNVVVWNRPECDLTNDVAAVLAQAVGVPKKQGGALGNISGQLAPGQAGQSVQPAQQPAAPAAQ